MLNEVAPPGWGHTKAEKEKTKPDKPKSKIGGSAAAFKRALDDGRFKGLPGDKTKKEKTASMFKLMWSMKKKGAKPHYKPGTDKKFKKYQESVENGKVDLTLKAGVNNVLKQDNREYDRGLLTQVNKDGSYDVAYWYDKYKAYPVEVEIDGKTCAKDAKNIHIKFHPELKKEDWKPEIEHIKGSDLRKKAAEKKRKEAADSLPPHLRLDAMKKAFKHTNEGVTYGYKGKKYKKLPAGVKTSSGWGTDARDEFGKLKDAITDKLGKTNTKRDGVKVPKGHQDESFIPEGDRHPRDQKELDRAKLYIKKNPNFGKKKEVKEEDVPRGPGGNPVRIKDKIKAAKGQIPHKIKEGREERSGKDNYLPFKVCYDDAEPYVLYGRSVAEIKIQLRKIYRPEMHKKIYVKRLYPNEVIKMYYDLRQKALTNQ